MGAMLVAVDNQGVSEGQLKHVIVALGFPGE